MIGGSGTPRSLSTSSTILDDADEPLDSTDPPNPMDIMRGSMHVPGRLNAYFVERRYLNMPNPAFREELPMTEAQAAVFKDFHISRLAIRDTPGHPAVHVDFLVPKRIFGGDNISNCPVHVRFHGGGFVSSGRSKERKYPLTRPVYRSSDVQNLVCPTRS
jgi:acetyl esterase/lipase